jgi:hypothetical protein
VCSSDLNDYRLKEVAALIAKERRSVSFPNQTILGRAKESKE